MTPALEACWSGADGEVERALHALLDGAAAADESLTHVLATRGKRVRSLLTLAAASLHGEDARPVAAAYHAAAAIEAVHEASLVHDDVVDRAEARRGQASVMAKFGTRAAVFTGAFLAAKGMAALAELCERCGTDLDFGLIREMAEAQILEFLPPCADAGLREQRLRRVADGKTGALFKLAVRLGAGAARSAGASSADPALLDDLAGALGRAFQVRDDILDLLGDASLRRRGGSDLARGTLSWPLHYWVRQAIDPRAAMQRLRDEAGDSLLQAALAAEVLGTDAVERAGEVLDQELDKALGRAACLPASSGREAFLRFAEGLRLQ